MYDYNIVVVGHITKDIVRIGHSTKMMPGGTGFYFSIALQNLLSNFLLITKLAGKDEVLLNHLLENNISIFQKASPETTIFENLYPKDLSHRTQNLIKVAAPFTLSDIQDISAKFFHFGPLTKGDIPLEILKHISKKAVISLDIQGYLRKVEDGIVKWSDWAEKEEGLTYINILKASEMEAEILTGMSEVNLAAIKLASYGIDEVIITLASKGSLIYSKNRFYSIPAFPVKKTTDATGCGDTYMAGYIYKRLESSGIEEAGKFASAIASLKLQKFGPYSGSKADIERLLQDSTKHKSLLNPWLSDMSE